MLIDKFKNKKALFEGGAVGHLSHVLDNRNLTFGEIREIIINATEGKLERASEKLDGMNLVFTYDLSENMLKAARSGGDIKRGGMDAKQLADKFFGRGNVEKAFNDSFRILDSAISSLSEKSKVLIFGKNGNRWYSMEIIYTENPNTIVYDQNSLVFHGWPVFELKKDGTISKPNDDRGINELISKVSQMQKAISARDWKIKGPSLVAMKNISNGEVASKLLAKLDEIKSHSNMSDDSTINDFLMYHLAYEIPEYIPEELSEEILKRCVNAPGALSVIEIKKSAEKDYHEFISSFIKGCDQKITAIILPLEKLIQELSIEVLRGVKSTLISDSDAEVIRLRQQVEKSIAVISSSGHEQAIEILNKELNRLKTVDNITSAMEGIVFFYKGNAYKFTGAFAPVNQILGLFKYGRKGIPKFSMSESKKYLHEGGHAFKDVSEISLANFNKIWPQLYKELISFGCTNIHPVGSTGKKHLMGDIDLAAEFEGTIQELLFSVSSRFGDKNAVKIGSNIVSFRFPYKTLDNYERFVQVDIMIGDADYLKWARAGTSNIEGHEDYSPLKGIARNILLNSINTTMSDRYIGKSSTDLDRVKFAIDFDEGLFKITQTKRNEKDPKTQLKNWKTVDKEFLTKDPQIIAKLMFGEEQLPNALRKFEDVVNAIKTSKNTKNFSQEIFSNFLEGLENAISKKADLLGHETDKMIAYIKTILA